MTHTVSIINNPEKVIIPIKHANQLWWNCILLLVFFALIVKNKPTSTNQLPLHQPYTVFMTSSLFFFLPVMNTILPLVAVHCVLFTLDCDITLFQVNICIVVTCKSQVTGKVPAVHHSQVLAHERKASLFKVQKRILGNEGTPFLLHNMK